MLDFAFHFITKNNIEIINKGLKIAPQILLEFKDSSSFSKCEKCELLDKYIFVIESDYDTYRVDIETKQIDTIDVHSRIKMGGCYRDVVNKIKGSDLYVLVANRLSSYIEAEYNNIRHLIIKPSDSAICEKSYNQPPNNKSLITHPKVNVLCNILPLF